MTAKDIIRNTIDTCHGVLTSYISDLTDEELLMRPVPEANHIAWQLGHVAASEREMMIMAGYEMPDLPPDFAECYTPETSKSDDPAKFHKKDEYLAALEQQRTATLATLDAMPDAKLDEPSPEPMQSYAPTIGSAFNLLGIHEMMHAGQFVAVRRKLGKPILI
jgi:hypothetical protein